MKLTKLAACVLGTGVVLTLIYTMITPEVFFVNGDKILCRPDSRVCQSDFAVMLTRFGVGITASLLLTLVTSVLTGRDD